MMMMMLKPKVMLGLHGLTSCIMLKLNSTAHKGTKLGDLDIDYTSDPYDFLKVFTTDSMITTIKE